MDEQQIKRAITYQTGFLVLLSQTIFSVMMKRQSKLLNNLMTVLMTLTMTRNLTQNGVMTLIVKVKPQFA